MRWIIYIPGLVLAWNYINLSSSSLFEFAVAPAVFGIFSALLAVKLLSAVEASGGAKRHHNGGGYFGGSGDGAGGSGCSSDGDGSCGGDGGCGGGGD
ncbi:MULTISPECIES: hypothetical protein [unclassified Thalassolituus]|uniref:hypothetical protein n=1 Tax=unclassified Thalassolituus TaxID=2624967 RepID=UPI0025E9938F|nr:MULTISPECIES: hypothetical protein [unclassified Thalassolituus]|tara:strand:+ start:431 stop:721 length:291 start_codon:yes stop_codon:yes gene_type:complete